MVEITYHKGNIHNTNMAKIVQRGQNSNVSDSFRMAVAMYKLIL